MSADEVEEYAYSLKRTLEAIEALIVTKYAEETGNGMRCHEIARITCKVLREIGYSSFQVIDGFVVINDETTMTHSWIEGRFSSISAPFIIETKPYDEQICPNSCGISRGEGMLVLAHEDKFKKYYRLEKDAFSKRLEDNKVSIDFDLVNRYTEGCLAFFLSDKGKEKLKMLTSKINADESTQRTEERTQPKI